MEAIQYAGLIQASDGNLYGTTVNGGIYGNGTVFQIGTNGSFTSLYSFTGGNDGANPVASLIQASDGYLYGTTEYGGNYGDGAVFQMSTNGSVTSLYSFTGGSDGGYPAAGLIQAGNGYLFGTASGGRPHVRRPSTPDARGEWRVETYTSLPLSMANALEPLRNAQDASLNGESAEVAAEARRAVCFPVLRSSRSTLRRAAV